MDFALSRRRPPLRSRQKRDLYKLLLARSDVNAACYSCELLLEKVQRLGDVLYYPLFASVVVCYARPFTQNRPFGSLGTKWAHFQNPALQHAHNEMIRARNELVAHSDMTVRRAKIIPPGYSIRSRRGKEFRSTDVGCEVSLYYFPVPFFHTAREAALDLGTRLNCEIDRLTAELYGGMELPACPFDLRIDEGL